MLEYKYKQDNDGYWKLFLTDNEKTIIPIGKIYEKNHVKLIINAIDYYNKNHLNMK